MIKKIVVASDHAGFDLKIHISGFLKNEGFEIIDLGTNNKDDSVDYPDYGNKLSNYLMTNAIEYGVLFCGSGIGISIAANRHKGIRCAVARSTKDAKLARSHNNANVIALGGRITSPEEGEKIVSEFLKIDFEGHRHQRRVDMLA